MTTEQTIGTDPAYPCTKDGKSYYGLTKREEIATRIFAGIQAIPHSAERRKDDAEIAVWLADALIAELNKT